MTSSHAAVGLGAGRAEGRHGSRSSRQEAGKGVELEGQWPHLITCTHGAEGLGKEMREMARGEEGGKGERKVTSLGVLAG